MANNCENRVEIYGDVENLKNLHGKLKGVSSLHLLEDVEMTYMEYLYVHDNDYFYDEIGYRSEYNTLGELILELGSVYDKLTDSEKQRVSEIHENNYQEEE